MIQLEIRGFCELSALATLREHLIGTLFSRKGAESRRLHDELSIAHTFDFKISQTFRKCLSSTRMFPTERRKVNLPLSIVWER